MPEAAPHSNETRSADAEPIESPASQSAAALLTALVAGGVREFVVCPGSRSQAPALAAVELERLGVARVHVRTDERTAGFLALGLARESRLPAAVITTSGSAVANLMPAVFEAHHSHVPLLLLTADRPAELHGTGANQTTRQAEIFGDFAGLVDVAAPEGSQLLGTEGCAAVQRRAREAVVAARGILSRNPGPVQINLAYREPLSGPLPPLAPLLAAGDAVQIAGGPVAERPTMTVPQDRPGVVIAGADAGEQAERFARAADWPLVAEVVSGARFGPNLVHYYRELLDDENFGGRARRAVVFGHPTLSREVAAFLARDDVDVIVVAPHVGEAFNPGRRAALVSAVRVSEPFADRAWAGRWVRVSRRVAEAMAAQGADEAPPDIEGGHSPSPKRQLEYVRSEFDAIRTPITHRMLAEVVWRFTWPHDRLVYGASRLVREADRVVRGRRVAVHANRGLGGIDGTISTAWGVALASQEVEDDDAVNSLLGVTRVLLGDVAFLHDVTGLQSGAGEHVPHLQIIVGNDGGGTIFDSLEVAKTAEREAFDRVMYTPHDVDIEALAQAYGCQYSRAETRGDLDRALSAPPQGVSVLEVRLGR